MDIGTINLAGFITPAISLAVLAYLTNFFGQIIADQYAFTDDRKWHIQIAGSWFMLNIIVGGTLGVWLANTLPIGRGHWWLHLVTFIVFSLIGSALIFFNARTSNKIFNIKTEQFKKIDGKYSGLASFYASMGKYIPVGILPIAVFYFDTLEFYSQNIYWIILFFSFGLMMFAWSALGSSFKQVEDTAPVTIYFVDKTRDPVTPARILKVNEDNIRLRVENKIVILNKGEVLKIEMEIPEKLL
jgi:hypothetical protein